MQQCCLHALLCKGFTKNLLTKRESNKIQGILKCYVPKCKEGPIHSTVSFQPRHLILHPFLLIFKRNWHRKSRYFGDLNFPPPSPNYFFVQASPKMTAPSPALSGYWLYSGMSHWGFIFRSVSLFISPFPFPFEANQAAFTSAQKGRGHLGTEIRS